MPKPMPAQVSHDDMLAALKPLCDLIGLTSEELYEVHFDRRGITVLAVPRRPGDDAAHPEATAVPGEYAADDPRAFAELHYAVTVKVGD